MPINFRKFLSAATIMGGVLISSHANFASADCSRGSLDTNYWILLLMNLSGKIQVH
jgi:hypothetical protein